jgi:heme-degrading monooxygenase HmoA
MVVEFAHFKAKEGAAESLRDGLRAAQAVIARSPGYMRSTFYRGIEEPDAFVVRIEWETIEAHMQGFRQGPLLGEWRGHFMQFVDGPPKMTHFEVFAER